MNVVDYAWLLVAVFFAHWLADFVWQPHWMSMRKSKEWWVLTQHASRIGAGALLIGWCIHLGSDRMSGADVIGWTMLNAGTHFAIDAVTSRATSRLYARQKIHEFFTVIGFDQFLHTAIATAGLAWLLS